MHPRPAARELEARLRAVGTPERAAGEKRYLKSELEHFGAAVPDMRRAIKTLPSPTHDELVALVKLLWARPVFECRFAAGLLLERDQRIIGPNDLALIKELIGDSYTWALVDLLATDVIGYVLIRNPDTTLDEWAEDPDFWIRRAALISLLRPLKAGAVEFERFARYADAMLGEREFFIRKAIGWVLRDVGKRDPDTVARWLRPRIDRASGVTVREAVKYLTDSQREELTAAHRKRRGRPHGAPSKKRMS
jgi:3-methyladenine DNA glycosylase AlkD